MSRQSRQELLRDLFDEIRISQTETDAFDDAVATLLGVNRTDMRALDILDRLGPIAAGRLAEETHLTTGAVTALVDRLERRGFVRRTRDARDRRRVLVELTPKARQASTPFYEPMLRASTELTARYSDEQLRLFVEFMRAGRAAVREHQQQVIARASRRAR